MDLSSIIEQLAKKHNLTKGAVTLILNSQFSFIRKTISSKELKTIFLPKLGKFAVKPNRIKLLNARVANAKAYEEAKRRSDLSRTEESNTGGSAS